jgi:hypothetical protein
MGCLTGILKFLGILLLFFVLWLILGFGLMSLADWCGDGLWPWQHTPWGPT